MALKRAYSGMGDSRPAKRRYTRRAPRAAAAAAAAPFWARPSGEWKYSDVTLSVAVNSDFPTITLLNGLQPGNTATTRIGQKVSIRSLEYRLGANSDIAGGLQQFNRFIILLDKQTNTVGPAALTDFLSVGTVFGLRALTQRKRFKIIRDKTYVMTPPALDYGRRWFKGYVKFRRPLIVEYNAGVAGNVADIVSNSLHIVTVGTEVAGNTDGALNGQIRIRYTDV